MRLHELGHNRQLFLLNFDIKCRSVAERLPDKLTVSKHSGAIAHQVIVGSKETLLDFVLGECERGAFFHVFKFLIALEYHASIFIRGTTTVQTSDWEC